MKKKIIISLIIFLGIFIIIIPNFLNLNNYKSVISKKIYDITGHHLVIDGDMKIFFMPKVQVKIKDAKLFNDLTDKQAIFVIKEIQVKLEILPLLRKQIKISELIIDQLNIDYHKDAQIKKINANYEKPVKETDASHKKNIYHLENIIIKNSNLNYYENPSKLLSLNNINITSKLNSEFEPIIEFSLINKDKKFEGKFKSDSIESFFEESKFDGKSKFDLSISKLFANKDAALNIIKFTSENKIKYESGKVIHVNLDADSDGAMIDELLDHDFYTDTSNKHSFNLFKASTKYEEPKKLNLDLNLNLNAKNTIIKSLLIEKFHSNIALKNDDLSINIKDMTIYEGNAKGNINISNISSELPNIVTELSVKNIEINHLLKNIKLLKTIKAKGNLVLDLNSRGKDSKIITANLKGNGNINLSEGVINDINPELKSLINMISKQNIDKLSFDRINGDFNIDHGIVNNDNLEIDSNIISFAGSGTINLNNQKIDYKLTPIKLLNKDNKDKISLSITGKLAEPKYNIDLNEMLIDKLKNKFLKKVSPELIDKLNNSIGKEVINNNVNKLLDLIK